MSRRCLICSDINPCRHHSDAEQAGELRRNDAAIARIRAEAAERTPPPMTAEQGDVEKVARIIDPRSWSRFDCCYPFAANIPREQGIAWTIELQSSLTRAREIIAALKAPALVGDDLQTVATAGTKAELRQFFADHIDPPPPALEAAVKAWAIHNGKLTPTETDDLIAALSPAPLQGDQLAKLKRALKPFASFAKDFVVSEDEGGYRWDSKPGRIVDWFGPSDFGRLMEALSATGEE